MALFEIKCIAHSAQVLLLIRGTDNNYGVCEDHLDIPSSHVASLQNIFTTNGAKRVEEINWSLL